MYSYNDIMMDFKEIFHSDNVELFEKSCNSPPSDRAMLSELFQCVTDTNTDVGIRSLSEKLSALADRLGFTEEARKMLIETYKVQNVLSNFCESLMDDIFVSRCVGSRTEATASLNTDSDMDFLSFHPTIQIYQFSKISEANMPYLLMVGDKKTPAGYKKIQLFHNGHAVDEEIVKEYEPLFVHKLIVVKSMVFLSNELTDKETNNPPYDRVKRDKHGPALTYCDRNYNFDIVPAYICKELPDEVKQWFRRERRYGWPSEEAIQLFKQMGCVVVAIGHENSSEQKLQWRLSFTNQEMYLMHNLNTTQYKCYVILKCFKRAVLNVLHFDFVCSYHLKTVLFYTIENSSTSIWQPKYLAYVVLKCLHNLRERIVEMNCPNYFIPQENMFETKLCQEEKERFLYCFKGVFKNKYCLQKFQHTYDHILINNNEMLLYCSNILQGSLQLVTIEFAKFMEQKNDIFTNNTIDNILQCLNIFTDDNKSALCPRLCGYSAFPELLISVFFVKYAGICVNESCLHDAYNMMPLPTFQDIYPILINSSAMCRAVGYIKRFLHSIIASHALLSCQNPTRKEGDMLYDLVNNHAQKAGITHGIHTRLKQASCLLIDGQHELVDSILKKEFTQELNVSELPVVCNHFSFRSMDVCLPSKQQNPALRKLKPYQLTVDYIIENTFTCLIFDTMEARMVPEPLQYETFKAFGSFSSPLTDIRCTDFFCVTIDPIIYLYYLCYKNKEKIDEQPGMSFALFHFESIMLDICQETKLWHLDTALNCLGHIYVTKGWNRLAIRSFRKSLDVELLHNSAKWHIMFLLFG